MKQKIKKFIQEVGILSISLSIAFLTVMGVTIARGWVNPTVAPPGENVAAPINIGDATQVKSGALGVNGVLKGFTDVIGEQRLCIGNDCRSSWPDGGEACVSAVVDALPNKGKACSEISLLMDGKNICADNNGCNIRGAIRLDANNNMISVRDNEANFFLFQDSTSHWAFAGATSQNKINGDGDRKVMTYFGNQSGSLEMFDDVPNGDFASYCNSNGTIENNKDAFTIRATNSDKYKVIICD